MIDIVKFLWSAWQTFHWLQNKFVNPPFIYWASKGKRCLCTSFSPLPHRKLLSAFDRDNEFTHKMSHEGQLCSRGGVRGGTAVEKLHAELLHQLIGLERVGLAHEGREALAGWGDAWSEEWHWSAGRDAEATVVSCEQQHGGSRGVSRTGTAQLAPWGPNDRARCWTRREVSKLFSNKRWQRQNVTEHLSWMFWDRERNTVTKGKAEDLIFNYP